MQLTNKLEKKNLSLKKLIYINLKDIVKKSISEQRKNFRYKNKNFFFHENVKSSF